MAANISTQNGINEVFVAGAPAWHNLGVNVKDAQTWEKAIKLAHLDWTISKKQLLNPMSNELIPAYAIVRDDNNKFLSVVGEKYTPIQNQYCFDFVDALLESGDAHFESAGALGNGETVWCLARLNENFSPVKGDVHNTFLLFTDNREGKAATVKLTTVRVVCNNTLTMALSQKTGDSVLRLRHTHNVGEKMQLAKGFLKDVSANVHGLNDKLKQLTKVKLNKTKFSLVMKKLFPEIETSSRQQNQAGIISNNFLLNDDNAFPEIKGTAYGLLQACTQYVDHQKDGYKVGDSTLQVKRAESAIFGSGDEWKREALDNILSICTEEQPQDSVSNILNMVGV